MEILLYTSCRADSLVWVAIFVYDPNVRCISRYVKFVARARVIDIGRFPMADRFRINDSITNMT